ncbi:endonuclease domain-containing protein [Deinococcus koreensis]|uniref:Type II restriction endonuclease n=1 Tax=Deinococcus koreensis TaxID=2054903 RepID=A0A2K3UVH1_9DEIO|nr:endonuclease domain-containing protein [Deinococcus koreensis]PNY80521.1 type II restriction endonuclease [Deinococcus koreensis]
MRDTYTRKLVPRAKELRREQTPAERKLWFLFLRTHPVKFRRQVPMHGYILDFYAPSVGLCIELDGRSHDGEGAQAYDAERTRVLEAGGVRVLRLSNGDVEGEFQAVCGAVEVAIREGTPL